jgi:hypothetical protein
MRSISNVVKETNMTTKVNVFTADKAAKVTIYEEPDGEVHLTETVSPGSAGEYSVHGTQVVCVEEVSEAEEDDFAGAE